MKKPDPHPICLRVAQVREQLHGRRGRSAFAAALGIAPSSYAYYESTRVPPADLLVQMARLGGVDLQWLLTGHPAPASHAAIDSPVLTRAAELLKDRPQAAEALGAFLELLSRSMAFPQKQPAPQSARPARAEQAPVEAPRSVPAVASPAPPEAPSLDVRAQQRRLIPILGRSAAGVAHFWKPGESAGAAGWDALIARHVAGASHHARQAQASGPAGDEGLAWLVTSPLPDEQGLSEFVWAGALKDRHADAFAVRIDGQSMQPDIRHGDVVIVSPSVPAIDGQPALVQLAGQIGLTCKVYRRQGSRVHLIPLNGAFKPESFPARKVDWALRVLAKVRVA